MNKRIFVLAPHPDDEVLGAGGTIARHAAEGDEVFVAILTRGRSDLYSDESIRELRAEAREAHKLLGVEDSFFCDDLPAPGLDTVPEYKVTAVIASWLEKIEPSVLYLPHQGDRHVDHTICFDSAMVAARPGYSSVETIYSYETRSETEWAAPFHHEQFVPNVFVDISDHLTTKTDAMQRYRSQVRDFPNPRSVAGLEALARYRGSSVNVNAAEAFMLIRTVR
jgi:LmbE family N-acetylglucosaminyl deacetylase